MFSDDELLLLAEVTFSLKKDFISQLDDSSQLYRDPILLITTLRDDVLDFIINPDSLSHRSAFLPSVFQRSSAVH
ncbi:unnamed protein product [Heligmosomoides polygyrus]|uniref:Uncharacterized protein n=1 Tax=Heligmosomoides polygyrus TaxID=6339 RepID=A0A183FG89_HELPZ|nr:unnamed protein product [Heligmosomoides polygyrus]